MHLVPFILLHHLSSCLFVSGTFSFRLHPSLCLIVVYINLFLPALLYFSTCQPSLSLSVQCTPCVSLSVAQYSGTESSTTTLHRHRMLALSLTHATCLALILNNMKPPNSKQKLFKNSFCDVTLHEFPAHALLRVEKNEFVGVCGGKSARILHLKQQYYITYTCVLYVSTRSKTL